MVDFEALFNDSFQRLLGGTSTASAFLDHFYARFLASSPVVREKFAHTDMARQKLMLHESMAFMTTFARRLKSSPYIEGVARRHGPHDLDISPELFDLWLDCLIETVGEMDKSASPETLTAWRIMMAPGLAYMKSSVRFG